MPEEICGNTLKPSSQDPALHRGVLTFGPSECLHWSGQGTEGWFSQESLWPAPKFPGGPGSMPSCPFGCPLLP